MSAAIPAIGPAATAAGDIETANITAKGNLAAQQQAAANAQALSKQSFDQQTGYINQSEKNQRAAISGAQNPALNVKALMTAPTKTAMAPSGTPQAGSTGGQVFSGGQAASTPGGGSVMSQAQLQQLFGGGSNGGGGLPNGVLANARTAPAMVSSRPAP